MRYIARRLAAKAHLVAMDNYDTASTVIERESKVRNLDVRLES